MINFSLRFLLVNLVGAVFVALAIVVSMVVGALEPCDFERLAIGLLVGAVIGNALLYISEVLNV